MKSLRRGESLGGFNFLACHWAFRWAKIRSKSRLKSKSKV